MKRSPGVTVIAILVLLGSTLTLLLGIVTLIAALVAPRAGLEKMPGPSFLPTLLMAFVSVMYLVPAGIGIASGVGLLRLKNWARISTIVFSVVLICISIFPALLIPFMPFPTPPDQSLDQGTITAIRIFMSAFCFSQVAVGVWWLVFFTRQSVRQQFQRAKLQESDQPLQPQAYGTQESTLPANAASPRPVSITVIACLMIAGAALMPPGIFFQHALHTPAIFFTKLLTGWGVTVFFGIIAVVQFFVGWGLLKLKPLARTFALAYLTFNLLNLGVFYLAPDRQTRIATLMESQISMMQWTEALGSAPKSQFHPAFFIVPGLVFGAVAIAVQIYFLLTRKAAFQTA